jgi:hypothetical protein
MCESALTEDPKDMLSKAVEMAVCFRGLSREGSYFFVIGIIFMKNSRWLWNRATLSIGTPVGGTWRGLVCRAF